MSKRKSILLAGAAAAALALLLAVLFLKRDSRGPAAAESSPGYESTLFDVSRVHSVDILVDDWDAFLETAPEENYASCAVVIDGETVRDVGIRGKGNTSLATVASMGSRRYSFKIEFDHYQDGQSYRGLDKLCLNNLIQDNTCMKDYLAYRLMADFGVDAPLCAYVWVTVNGEDWGLYLAVEAVEDSFLDRVYGGEGELYKPDSLSMGGGPGNGRDFDMDAFLDENAEAMGLPREGEEGGEDASGAPAPVPPENGGAPQPPGGGEGRPQPPGGENGGWEPPSGFPGGMPGGGEAPGGMGVGSGDVKLQYCGEDPESYANIFDNAKSEVSEEDKARLIRSLKALSEGEELDKVLDLDELLRYFAVHNYLVNSDSYTGAMVHNYYLHEEDGRLSMIPWDYNLAFGSFQAGDASAAVNDPIDSPLSVSGDGSRPMADWIFGNEEYTRRYHQLLAEFLESTDIQGLIDETFALIAPCVEKDPSAFCSPEEFRTGVEALRSFCRKRTESVLGQLAGSIPSTDAGQQAEPSALVDASDLDLAELGGMDGGPGGPGLPGGPGQPGGGPAEPGSGPGGRPPAPPGSG